MRSLVIERIESDGPLPFDEFMELCLYEPDHGYFAAGSVRPGESGDFVTAPEVSPYFGRCVGNWVANHLPDDRRQWAVVEIGAGSGSLITSLMGQIPDDVPVHAVERSAAARAGLADGGISVGSDLTVVEASNAVVVMNEVIDNIPAALVRRTPHGWLELGVGVDGNTLTMVEIPARVSIVAWSDRHLGDVQVGRLAVAHLRAASFVDTIMRRFDGIAVAIIDYGAPSHELFVREPEGLVRTYRHQRTGFDFLAHPGETDITVDMNTDVIAAIMRGNGAEPRVENQRQFLQAWGASEFLGALQEQEHARARDADVLGQLKARSDAVGLRAVMDEGGFGSFMVVSGRREPGGRS